MNSKVILFVLGIGLVIVLLTMCSASKGSGRVDNSTVGSVDLDRYEGAWYEIVRKPHTFERDMTDVRATYTRHPNGKIGVRNEGFKHGRPKVAKGSARAGREPGQLMVTFFLFPGEYNIMELGPNYEYSVVGGSNGGYLWILSRTPTMPQEVLDGIYSRLTQRGYDLSDIIVVDQSRNIQNSK
ncbi:MAG: lipocalin family protein [Tidjanibacter sp.]|nr:lipocalin family protein [Tidjanibacter sp.]